ncbi:MAG: MFS transporter [Clostridiales bacterium]|jgi:MFS family permease|nr:MFS transporter [Clostridiales bacterium]
MIFIIYGLLYDTVINLYKPFAVKYLERLGGTNLHITLYNSVPGVVAVVVLLPCLFILGRFKKKRRITAAFIFLARLTILAMAFTELFPVYMRPLIFVGLISFLNFPEAVSQSSMQSILGVAFGGKERALALSARNQFGNFFIMLVTLISGLVISFIPQTDEQRMLCYQLFFVFAFLLGLLEVFFFSRMDEKNNPSYTVDSEDKPPRIKDIGTIFKDKRFLAFAGLSILYYIVYHGGWAISSIYTIKSLGANEIWLALFAVISGLASFFSAPLWNKFINRKGNDYALIASCYIMGINTLVIVLSQNLYVLLFQSIINGLGVIGFNVTFLNGLLINTPVKNRILYIGMYNTFVNLSLGLSPLLVQAFMDVTDVRAALFLIGFLRIIVSSVILYFLVLRKSGTLGDILKNHLKLSKKD